MKTDNFCDRVMAYDGSALLRQDLDKDILYRFKHTHKYRTVDLKHSCTVIVLSSGMYKVSHRMKQHEGIKFFAKSGEHPGNCGTYLSLKQSMEKIFRASHTLEIYTENDGTEGLRLNVEVAYSEQLTGSYSLMRLPEKNSAAERTRRKNIVSRTQLLYEFGTLWNLTSDNILAKVSFFLTGNSIFETYLHPYFGSWINYYITRTQVSAQAISHQRNDRIYCAKSAFCQLPVTYSPDKVLLVSAKQTHRTDNNIIISFSGQQVSTGGKVLYRCWASGKYDMSNHQNMFLLAPRGMFLRLKIQIDGNTPQNALQFFANWIDGKQQISDMFGPMYMDRSMFDTPYNAYCQHKLDVNEELSFCGITSDQLYQHDKTLSWNEASKILLCCGLPTFSCVLQQE